MSAPHVVIIGGGFAGLSAAKTLRRAPVDVTLIDRTNHYLFQPLLYQVATGVLSPADIAMPTRFLLRGQKNVEVLLANVTRIDLDRRTVHTEDTGAGVPFDYLILATGAQHSYFQHPEWEAIAPGLKTLDDARRIRRRFLLALEEAEKTPDPAAQSALLTFVVVGGGPTGVELAGILPTIAHKGFRGDFRRIDPRRVRIVLLEGGPRLLAAFPDALSGRARRDLEELGVEVRTGALVTALTRDAVYVGDERIAARTVFWAAGNQASPLVATMGVPMDRSGRALVLPDLSVPAHPNVFVVGDAAAAAMPGASSFVPALAAAANQMGEHAARMIVRTLGGMPHVAFRYRNKGALAVIGRGRAIADFGRIRLTGMIAFLTWFFVHLLYLAGFRNRVSAMVQWVYSYWTYRPSARLVTDEDRETLRRSPTS